jgi:gamma-glutamyltranspeptidase
VRGAKATAPEAVAPQSRPTGDTIAVVTADGEGRGVSLIQSLFYGFGSQLLEPDTGIVAHNRGACFVTDPSHPNALAPRRRPAHTLMPVVVQRGGRLAAVAGTMGGYAQPQIDATVLLRCLGRGEPPADAVAAPRWTVGGLDRDEGAPLVEAESGVPEAAAEAIVAAGFSIGWVDPATNPLGHAQLIRAGGATLEAGSDPRSDGGAMAG